ncbi:MAG: hypothetical protein ACRC5A_07980 [Enterobacteriaceae bacterium]
MKTSLISTSLLLMSAFTVQAAQISFHQQQPSDPFIGQSSGVHGLEQRTVLGVGPYQLYKVSQGVANATVSIGDQQNPPGVPAGSIAWNSQQQSCDGGNYYTVQLSAGGNPGQWDPKQRYEIIMKLNGQEIGTNTTNPKTYWAPTTIHNVCLGDNSQLDVTLNKVSTAP